jgi:hypothetical protein
MNDPSLRPLIDDKRFGRLLRKAGFDRIRPEDFIKVLRATGEYDRMHSHIEVKEKDSDEARRLRRVLALFLMAAFAFTLLLLLLHSMNSIVVPEQTLGWINKAIVAELGGLLAVLVRSLWGRK